MTAGTTPAQGISREWLELRFDTIEGKLDKLNGTVSADHDVSVQGQAWREGHEKTHVRERGIFGFLLALGTAVGSALGLIK